MLSRIFGPQQRTSFGAAARAECAGQHHPKASPSELLETVCLTSGRVTVRA